VADKPLCGLSINLTLMVFDAHPEDQRITPPPRHTRLSYTATDCPWNWSFCRFKNIPISFVHQDGRRAKK
jgi:hypothetical protein